MKKIIPKDLQSEFGLDCFKGMTEFPIEEVFWLDAQHSTIITDFEELITWKPLITKSIGYLILEKENYIILGFTLFGNGAIKHTQLIPKAIIIKRNTLRNGGRK